MPFFLPRCLVELEYSGKGEVDPVKMKYLDKYSEEVDFAFFVVNFHYSKEDYEQLTPKDKMFIRKAFEEKIVRESTEMRNSVLNAVINALRKKNQKFVELWKKKQKPVNKGLVEKQIDIIMDIEERDGKNWVDAIYRANRMKKPERGVELNG